MSINLSDTYKEKLAQLIQATKSQDLKSLKEKALKSFYLPSKKIEDWKYTSLATGLPQEFTPDSTGETQIEQLSLGHNLEFVGGILSKNNLPPGVSITEVEKTSKHNQNDELDNFNFLANQKTYLIKVSKNTHVEGAICIIHATANKGFSFPRIEIIVEEMAEASFCEIFTGTGEYSTNSSTHFHVKKAAQVEHVKIGIDSYESINLSSVIADVDRDATFNSFTFSNGAKLTRNNVTVNLNEQNATANAHGLYALKDDQHCDNFINVVHNVSHTYSDQLFKGILSDSAHGVFTGKVLVQRNALLIDSSQLNKNLLLSDKAKVNTRPQLEVYADDVKCAHGATIGQLSEEEVFYLQSRGIEQEAARKILCNAFGSDAVNKVKNTPIREFINQQLFERSLKDALEGLSQ